MGVVTGETWDARWSAGEVVRLLVDVGSALERLGRAHGRLAAPGSWTVDSAGGVVLASDGDGTGSAADDVDALARIGLTLLGRLPGECTTLPPGLDLHVPEQSAAHAGDGRPWHRLPGVDADEAADDGGADGTLVPRMIRCPDDDVPRERLRHVLLLAAHRRGRTTLRLLVHQALAVSDPVPVRRTDPAVLARDALVRRAVAQAPPGGRGRHRRRGPARGLLVPVAAGVAVLGIGLTAFFGTGLRPAGPPGGADDGGAPADTVRPGPALVPGRPVVLADPGTDALLEGDVVVLTRMRAVALLEEDLLRLLRVTAPGSPAALADLAQFGRLRVAASSSAPEGGADRVRAGSVDLRVEQVSTLESDEHGARVLLVAAVGPGDVAGPTSVRGVVLSLTDRAGVWQVRDVTAGPSVTPASATGGP